MARRNVNNGRVVFAADDLTVFCCFFYYYFCILLPHYYDAIRHEIEEGSGESGCLFDLAFTCSFEVIQNARDMINTCSNYPQCWPQFSQAAEAFVSTLVKLAIQPEHLHLGD